jgi:hypothetical protein
VGVISCVACAAAAAGIQAAGTLDEQGHATPHAGAGGPRADHMRRGEERRRGGEGESAPTHASSVFNNTTVQRLHYTGMAQLSASSAASCVARNGCVMERIIRSPHRGHSAPTIASSAARADCPASLHPTNPHGACPLS